MSVAIERGRGGQFRAGKEDVLQRNNGPIVGGNTRRTISYKENYMKLWSTERNTSDFSSTKDKSLLFFLSTFALHSHDDEAIKQKCGTFQNEKQGGPESMNIFNFGKNLKKKHTRNLHTWNFF